LAAEERAIALQCVEIKRRQRLQRRFLISKRSEERRCEECGRGGGLFLANPKLPKEAARPLGLFRFGSIVLGRLHFGQQREDVAIRLVPVC